MKKNIHQGIELLVHPPSPQSSPLLPPLSSLLCQPSPPRHYLPSPISIMEPQFSPCSTPILLSPLPSLVLPPPVKRHRSNPPMLSRDNLDSIERPLIMPKRKRGRPPNKRQKGIKSMYNNNWTFVPPTVCSVKQNKVTCSKQDGWQWSNEREGINTFMNSKMDMPLSMPNKKRGRKPKVQLKGNFCFVWRDLTARRGANKK